VVVPAYFFTLSTGPLDVWDCIAARSFKGRVWVLDPEHTSIAPLRNATHYTPSLI